MIGSSDFCSLLHHQPRVELSQYRQSFLIWYLAYCSNLFRTLYLEPDPSKAHLIPPFSQANPHSNNFLIAFPFCLASAILPSSPTHNICLNTHPPQSAPTHHRPFPPSPNISRILASAPPYIPRAIQSTLPHKLTQKSAPHKLTRARYQYLSPVIRLCETCFSLQIL
jgi:hypothetical protein